MLTMVTFNLKERERCNVQVSIIDSSHFIIHTIMLLCHYDVIKKCLIQKGVQCKKDTRKFSSYIQWHPGPCCPKPVN